MTPAGQLLRELIVRGGPIPFRDFMEVALYHPQHGYYTRLRGDAPDPFGKQGDFYTAQQLQPSFGILIAQVIRQLQRDLEAPAFTVVELGAGRGEMAPYFLEWSHVPVDAAWGKMPEHFDGVVFANEFFDALPVHSVVRGGGGLISQLVGVDGERFVWVDGKPVEESLAGQLRSYGSPQEDGNRVEVNLDALAALDRIHRSMNSGFLLAIDYGYTTRELVRFPDGTLMSYRRHQALDDVLDDPGDRDITAHVNFSALRGHAESLGWRVVRFESMASLLLRAGEPDQFACVLEKGLEDERERSKRRLQLKTLLYGMGETFRVLLLRK